VEAPSVPVPREIAASSLERRLGIAIAEQLLRSDESNDRVRALERLGAVGTTRAIELIVRSLEPSGAARGARERLVGVRALSPHTSAPNVRRALVRIMTGTGARTSADQSDPLEHAARDAATLALAASHEREALEALGKALRQEGPLAESAARAVEAHPPADITPFIAARGAPTQVLARTLGRLGDQRAFHALRSMVKDGTPALRAEAALALTRLGHLETVALARHWLKHDKSVELRVGAARILAQARAADRAPAIARLLGEPETREAGIELALAAPHRDLVKQLAAEIPGAPATELPSLFAAIARAGGPEAARVLGAELKNRERGALAAHALSLSPGEISLETLEQALQSPATRRLAARAAVLRSVLLDEHVAGTEQVLESLLASEDASDRAAGAWGLAVLDRDRVLPLLLAKDPATCRAAARAVLGTDAVSWALSRLQVERDPITSAALAIALADSHAADGVRTETLVELIDRGGVEAPLAARALAMRDEAELRPRIEDLLESSDPILRAHAALGLGASTDASAVGLLERVYRFEPDVGVRRAVVVAISQRPERKRERLLRLAATLDGDRDARESARLALSGRALRGALGGNGSLWLALVPNAAANEGSAVASRPVLVGVPGGLALPAVADPDGLLVLARLPPGAVTLRLAPWPVRGNAR
jgi:cellulose synthase operon protein C